MDRAFQRSHSLMLRGTFYSVPPKLAEKRRIIDEQEALSDPSLRTCFQCEYNLQWANRNGYANCGAWKSMSVPQKTPPSCARACKRFRRIIS